MRKAARGTTASGTAALALRRSIASAARGDLHTTTQASQPCSPASRAALSVSAPVPVPLRDELQHNFYGKFADVVRATIKGTIVVAIVQGALGGIMFWFLGIQAPVLWGVVMAFLSLLPAVGTALVWAPVAIYFLATGAIWQGVVLAAYGLRGRKGDSSVRRLPGSDGP